jgi:alcohol dehydrogenase class IV
MEFEFATSSRIIFGLGSLNKLPHLVGESGFRVFLATGFQDDHPLYQRIKQLLDDAGMITTTSHVLGEPTIESIQSGVEQAKTFSCDLVIGFGGGSSIDTGKAIAVLVQNPGDLLDYLEVIGSGAKIRNPSLPFIAIPTTAGTGAEVTRNAVIGSPQHKVKVSLRSPLMLPSISLVDPELTLSLPPDITASTGFYALTQVIEPFLSKASNPLTDSLCRSGILYAGRSLSKAFHNPKDANARQEMSLASLFGGLALANAKLGAVHGFAGPIGGVTSAPHGAICAQLLPIVMRTNLSALETRDASNPVLIRYEEIAQVLTDDHEAKASNGVNRLFQLRQELQIPSLASYGVNAEMIPDLVESARQSSSMKGNPIELNEFELISILEEAL